MIQSVSCSPRRRASAWQVKLEPARQHDRALRCPSTSNDLKAALRRACTLDVCMPPLTPSGGGVAFVYAWEHCSMLVELCACLHCDALDLPPVCWACRDVISAVFDASVRCSISIFDMCKEVSTPSMVPGPGTRLLLSRTRIESTGFRALRNRGFSPAGQLRCRTANLSAVRSPVSAGSGCDPGRF